MPAIRRAYTGGLEAAFESRTGTAAGGGHYPMLLFLARLSGLWRRSQVVRQRSAKPPFVGSIPTGASLSHRNKRAPDLEALLSRGMSFQGWFLLPSGHGAMKAPIQLH